MYNVDMGARVTPRGTYASWGVANVAFGVCAASRSTKYTPARADFRSGRPGRGLALGRPRRVAVVEHQRVAIRIGEEGHVAHARIERVALKLHPAALEL